MVCDQQPRGARVQPEREQHQGQGKATLQKNTGWVSVSALTGSDSQPSPGRSPQAWSWVGSWFYTFLAYSVPLFLSAGPAFSKPQQVRKGLASLPLAILAPRGLGSITQLPWPTAPWGHSARLCLECSPCLCPFPSLHHLSASPWALSTSGTG